MTRTLAEQIVADASTVFLADFGEPFVFRPVVGAARTITAKVDEMEAPLMQGQNHTQRRRHIVVQCADDDTDGITTAEVQMSASATWAGERWSNPRVQARGAGRIIVEFDGPTIEMTHAGNSRL
jgi:hypothetical protein